MDDTALIETNNNKVQKPPNSLDRMHSNRGKQVAHNQRILSAEDEVDGINCDVAHFLAEMSPDPAEPVIICVNAGASMKRHEQHLGGQLWTQSNWMMIATNIPLEGMSNDATSEALAAVEEAVEWKHALELDGSKRTGQLVVIYPPHWKSWKRFW
jgi:hypothetical protein